MKLLVISNSLKTQKQLKGGNIQEKNVKFWQRKKFVYLNCNQHSMNVMQVRNALHQMLNQVIEMVSKLTLFWRHSNNFTMI